MHSIASQSSHRFIASLLAGLAAVAVVLVPARARAETVTLIAGTVQPLRAVGPKPVPESDANGKPITPMLIQRTNILYALSGVSFDDCEKDIQLTFSASVDVVSPGNTVQVWAGTNSADCTQPANRTPATATCWPVSAGIPEALIMTFILYGRDLAQYEDAASVPTTYGTEAGEGACHQQTTSAAVPITLFFLPLNPGNPATAGTGMGATFVATVDTVGPPPLTFGTLGIGDGELIVNWGFPNGTPDPDLAQLRVFCDPNPSAPDAGLPYFTSKIDPNGCAAAAGTVAVDSGFVSPFDSGFTSSPFDSGFGAIVGLGAPLVTAPIAEGGTGTFTVGGTVSGLAPIPTGASSLVLENNGKDIVAISTSASFTFPTPVAAGATYNVTVLGQPTGQVCTVVSPTGNGTATANVTSVFVSCAAESDAAVAVADAAVAVADAAGTSASSCPEQSTCTTLLRTGQYGALVPSAYQCSGNDIPGNTVTSSTITGLVNGTTYAFAVAPVDAFGNVGDLVRIGCTYPSQIENFWNAYEAAGGHAGGGCAAGGPESEAPIGTTLFAIGLIATGGAFLKRRSKRGGS